MSQDEKRLFTPLQAMNILDKVVDSIYYRKTLKTKKLNTFTLECNKCKEFSNTNVNLERQRGSGGYSPHLFVFECTRCGNIEVKKPK